MKFTERYDEVVDRTGWGEGPWDGEPDKVVWIDEATGYDCMARRSPHGGNWCGYVGLPPGHRWYGHAYDDVPVEVHGGLTFAKRCHDDGDPAWAICHVPQPGRPAEVYWLGFDCHHTWDAAPGFDARMSELEGWQRSRDRNTYRTLDYVVQECTALAAQAAEA